ncbi:NAD(P)/FAD-dependent oxidoreductase [Helicobacter didelphidarum]|uniref:NAD(P)/FAD-dependent oxidoreductase n=1 Tax=Helicobacter didelphidarum TaxID=2040648 RepID=A0A3D8IRR5_9HELI|nr:NAD(P)/FAD-dependent oxidoreductase [Helicobacter didelphidarum]RDU67605.1 NAD(P)/FAD-dependent oxidoreductase [Helicobacter didelphidarum]
MARYAEYSVCNVEKLKLPTNPRILIIGGGYGGLKVAMGLQKSVDFSSEKKPQITLISKHDYHYQTTLLHKVATGTLSARKARIYYRKLLKQDKVMFIKDKIIKLEPENNCVYGNGGKYEYDVLVIALGFRPDDFNIPGVKKYSFKLSTLNVALKLRQHIENKFKEFVHTKDPLDLHFIVCGTGFTSIEFAAELGSQFNELCTICGIDNKIPKITCIGRNKQILPVFSENLSQKAVQKLEKMNIEIITNGDVKEVKKSSVVIEKDGKLQELKANTILWGAGVKGSDIIEQSDIPNKKGKIEVGFQLRSLTHANIFVVGDSAQPTTKDAIHAPTAQLSAQMGEFVAQMLGEMLKGKDFDSGFVFKHRGTVCSIGHTDGVGIVYGKELSGEFAAFMKNTIENRWLFSLGGFPLIFKKGQFRYRTSN